MQAATPNDAPSDARNGPLPVEEVLALRRSVAAGETIAAAARRLGRSENAIRRAVRGRRGNLAGAYKGVPEAAEGGVDPVPPAATAGRLPRIGADVVRAVRAARARGEAVGAVARRLGISAGHASRIARGDARLDVEDAEVRQ